MNEGHRMVPLFIEPGSLKVLFIGGGRVAMRKAEHLRDCHITVISEGILEGLRELASTTIDRPFTEQDGGLLDDHDVVIAATDHRGLNDYIVREARSKGLLVNSVNGGGDFMIPSVLRREDFTVCVSTEGAAPVLPPFMVRTIDSMLDGKFDRMAALIKRVRNDIRHRIDDQRERARFLESLLVDEDLWDLLEEDPEEAYRTVRGMMP